jgi:hypothetical protein
VPVGLFGVGLFCVGLFGEVELEPEETPEQPVSIERLKAATSAQPQASRNLNVSSTNAIIGVHQHLVERPKDAAILANLY